MDKIHKLLKKLDRKSRDRVAQAINDIESRRLEGYSLLKLAGYRNLYRIRLGDYRIIFFMDENKVHVIGIRLRDENTYKHI